MPDACYRCGENSFDYVEGQVICCSCGTVVEESNIVSDVTFVEGGDGSSSVVGQFVSNTGGRSYGGRGLPGVQRPTREITLANGRRRISQLAQSLQLKSQHVDAAQRLFMLAVQHNFTQGRRSQHVVAACLYIVCRRLKTPHMLIDFSDVLQINVFVLGQTFLRLCQVLSIQPPVIDPSLYIHRFAAKLDFDDQEHEVATTALRIVQRMNRDWLQTGRRPAGICGAALMIAARLHGFQRSQRDIVTVVNICEMTLRKRLIEFENTPAAEQTFDEFQDETKDSELPASDPPSFRRARLMEELEELKKAAKVDNAKIEDILAKIRAIDRPPRVSRAKDDDSDEESDEESDEPVAEPKKKARTARSRKASAKKEGDAAKEGDEGNEEDSGSDFGDEQKAGKARSKKRKAASEKASKASSKRRKTKESETSAKKEAKSQKKSDRKKTQKLQIDEEQEEDPDTVAKEMQRIMQSQDTAQATQQVGSLQSQTGASSSANATQTTQANESVGNDDGDFQDIDDDELDVYFNTETEKHTKTSIWEEVNRDWIEAQAEKAKLKAAQAEAEAQAGGGKAKKPSKRKKQQNGAATAGEAASTTMQKKVPQKSDRINYSAIKMDALFERLGRDAAAADSAAPTLLPPPPAAQRRRYVSSLGEIVDSNAPTGAASADTAMQGLSSEFVAPVTAYRTKSSGLTSLTPQVGPTETTEGADVGGEYDEGEGGEAEYAEGEAGEYEGDEYAGGEDYAQDDYEAEFARMRQTTNDEEEYYYGQDDYY